jgi:hypothetical protein
MFDWYEPSATVPCPNCGRLLTEWQGKDGPNALLIWREGTAAPVDQRVDDDWRGDPSVIQSTRLPDEFWLYAHCACGTRVDALGTTTAGVWQNTVVMPFPDDTR